MKAKLSIIKCERHKRGRTVIVGGKVFLCRHCRREMNEYISEKQRELREYISTEFKGFDDILAGASHDQEGDVKK